MTKFYQCYIRIIFFLFALITLISSNTTGQTNSATLENILSVYIYNFTKFIEWPPNNSNDFKICVWGESDIIDPLNIIAEKEKVNGKKIVIDKVKNISDLYNCNILFMGEESEYSINKILENIKGKNILLITNSKGLAKQGAGINFLQVDDKIKFEINKTALDENKIIPNSRLLSLAVRIYN